MPRQNRIMGLIRALRDAGVQKHLQEGFKRLSPYVGELIIRGSELSKRHLPVPLHGIIEKITDKALTGYDPAILAEKVLGLAEKLAQPTPPDVPGPVAGAVPSRVSDRAITQIGDMTYARKLSSTRGNGKLLFGNDQPSMLTKKQHRDLTEADDNIADQEGEKEYTVTYPKYPKVYYERQRPDTMTFPPNPPAIQEKVPIDASEAGWYMRPVGPYTNIVNKAPGYGEQMHRATPQETKRERKKVHEYRKAVESYWDEKTKQWILPKGISGGKKSVLSPVMTKEKIVVERAPRHRSVIDESEMPENPPAKKNKKIVETVITGSGPRTVARGKGGKFVKK